MPGWIWLCMFACFIIGGILCYEEGKDVRKRKPYVREMTVCLVVCFALGMTGATYQAGRYTARQYEAKAGVTKAEYGLNRWGYRAALSGLVFIGGGTGAVAALAFDDYYMGL